MRLAVVRGRDPNISEFSSFRAFGDLGLATTLVAEASSQFRKSYAEIAPIPLLSQKGLDTLLLPFPMLIRPYGRFLIEQKLGISAPFLTNSWMNEFDVYNISDTVPFHGLQIARHIKDRRKRLIVTLWENVPSRTTRSLWGEKIRREIVNSTSAFVAVSQVARATATLDGIDPKRITVIQPGIDVELFRPGPKSPAVLSMLELCEDNFVGLFVGRLEESKGVSALLEAVAFLSKDPGIGRRLKIVLVGSSLNAPKFRSKAESLGIADCMRFAGHFPYAHLPEIYRVADAFILPSTLKRWWQEQFGFALVEAMASGVPVISTKTGAIGEVVEDCGLLVSPSNFYDLAQALRSLMVDDKLRSSLIKRARLLVEERNDARNVAERLARVYLDA
jgi:alpha-maltose-1-phosphate synthase